MRKILVSVIIILTFVLNNMDKIQKNQKILLCRAFGLDNGLPSLLVQMDIYTGNSCNEN